MTTKSIFLFFLLICLDALAQGMTLKKQGSGDLPNNRVLSSSNLTITLSSPEIHINESVEITSSPTVLMDYFVTSGACSVEGSTVTAGNSIGTCTIEGQYGNISKSITLRVIPKAQNLTVTAAANSIFTGSTTTLSTSGNQGAITYSVTSGSCTVSGNTVTAGSSAGTCTITATAAAVTGYSVGTATTSITVNALQAQNLTVTAAANSIFTGSTTTLSTSGNQGAITYSVTSGSCTVSGNTVTAGSSAGTCTITATAAAVTGYSVGTATTSITVNALQAQNLTVTAAANSIFTGSTTTLSTSGNQGAITYSVTSGSCTVSGNIVTAGSSAGTCTIRANAAAVTGYSAGTGTISITVSIQPDSGPLGNSYPQWAYFNRSSNDVSSNASSANTLCATLGSGWRLPTFAETGPGSHINWLDNNIGRGVQLFNSSGISNLQSAGWTTNYNYPYGSGFTINKVVCYHP